MKTFLGTLWFYSLASAAFAQGLVNFINTPSTLVSAGWGANIMLGPSGSYYFGLLIGPSPAGPFYFSGIYATNTAPGLFSGGSDVPVPIWMTGTSRAYEVAGWSADLGHDFNPLWLTMFPTNGVLGFSGIGTGVAGGVDSTQSFPTLDLFGGSTGIQSGFYLSPPIPEPPMAALTGLAVTLIFTAHFIGQRAFERRDSDR